MKLIRLLAAAALILAPIASVEAGTPNHFSLCAPDDSSCAGGNAANFAPGQATVTTTVASLVAARTSRLAVIVTQMGTTPVYLGSGSGLTYTNGLLLPGIVGASVSIPYAGAVWAVTASGSQAVSFAELY
jgi:hypothetical protein